MFWQEEDEDGSSGSASESYGAVDRGAKFVF